MALLNTIRYSPPIRIFRKLLPHSLVNNLWHWPIALIAVIINRYPARHLTVIGVTGTDGKTTTTHIVYHLLKTAGIKTALISTVSAKIGNQDIDTGFHVTSPHPFQLQKLLRKIQKAGITHVVLEATSHGLAQHRLLGCNFRIGVHTNLTPEHSDYHSADDYLKAKAKLFLKTQIAILNADCKQFLEFKKIILSKNPHCRVLSYSLEKKSDFRAKNISYQKNHTNFTLKTSPKLSTLFRSGIVRNSPIPDRTPLPPTKIKLSLNLSGSYNLSNTLAAAGATLSLSLKKPQGLHTLKIINKGGSPGVKRVTSQSLQKALSSIPPIPGRLESIPNKRGFNIIIDFAHTPNALEQVLKNIRQNQLQLKKTHTSRHSERGDDLAKNLSNNNLITLFGCAGLRDPHKRPVMGQISAKLSDITILTTEDPRTEDVNKIIDQIAKGCLKGSAQEISPASLSLRGAKSRHKTGRSDAAIPSEIRTDKKSQLSNVKGHTFIRIPDRQQAISFAIQKLAHKGDTILITGKGHEQSMCFGTREIPWSDHTAVQNALKQNL